MEQQLSNEESPISLQASVTINGVSSTGRILGYEEEDIRKYASPRRMEEFSQSVGPYEAELT
jgi:hypothetical protein